MARKHCVCVCDPTLHQVNYPTRLVAIDIPVWSRQRRVERKGTHVAVLVFGRPQAIEFGIGGDEMPKP